MLSSGVQIAIAARAVMRQIPCQKMVSDVDNAENFVTAHAIAQFKWESRTGRWHLTWLIEKILPQSALHLSWHGGIVLAKNVRSSETQMA